MFAAGEPRLRMKLFEMLDPAGLIFGRDVEAVVRERPLGEKAAAGFVESYDLSLPFFRALVARFDLAGKNAVSIGSGICAEEACLMACGVRVDCIDPNKAALDFGKAMLAERGLEAAFHDCPHSRFESARRFELIYTSAPGDWVHSDIRKALPDAYLRFFDEFGAERAAVVARLYGIRHRPDILGSPWYRRLLAARIAEGSSFRLREYWLSDDAMSATIVCTRNIRDLADGAGFSAASARLGSPSRLVWALTADDGVRLTARDRVGPYVTMARRIPGALRRRLKAVFGSAS